jgi:type IV secretion system protein VirB5
MIKRCLAALALSTCLQSPALAQGVPVIDGTNLARNVEMLQHHLRDAETQLRQLEQMRQQFETALRQLTNLEGILGSITGLNEIASLYNSVQDIRARAASITDLSGLQQAISIGDFDGIVRNLLDGEVTMGQRRAQQYFQETLGRAGFTPERLRGLSSSEENPQYAVIAETAAANAVSMAAAQLAYEEAQSSLERVEGLVEAISRQQTLKDSIDLNTRMAAETNFMLAQMWRLNAANGLASGQMGINWAAEQARQEAFFQFSGAEAQ